MSFKFRWFPMKPLFLIQSTRSIKEESLISNCSWKTSSEICLQPLAKSFANLAAFSSHRSLLKLVLTSLGFSMWISSDLTTKILFWLQRLQSSVSTPVPVKKMTTEGSPVLVLPIISLIPYVCGGLTITSNVDKTLGSSLLGLCPCRGPFLLVWPIMNCFCPSPHLVKPRSVYIFSLPNYLLCWFRFVALSVRRQRSSSNSTTLQWSGNFSLRSWVPIQHRSIPNESKIWKLEFRIICRLRTFNSVMGDPRLLINGDEHLVRKDVFWLSNSRTLLEHFYYFSKMYDDASSYYLKCSPITGFRWRQEF